MSDAASLLRPVRAIAVAAVLFASPAVASAATPSVTVTPDNLHAGGSPNVTTDVKFGASGDTPKTLIVDLAPGFLQYATANPSCLSTPNTTAGGPCQIGSGTLTTGPIPPAALAIQLFLVPPKPGTSDFAGVDVVVPPPVNMTTYSGVSVSPTSSLILTSTLPKLPLINISELQFTLSSKLDGKPFTRMPTSCAPATTKISVSYFGATASASASGSFTPTGCSSLPYGPKLSASVIKDRGDNGVTVTTTVSQAADEAASRSTTLTIPPAVAGPNGLTAINELNSPTPVGTATAASPLVSKPLQGNVFFTGTAASPFFTIKFPPPFAVTLTGSIDLPTNSVMFAGLPDLPLSSLALTLNGGPQALFSTPCYHSSGTVSASFVGQNGVIATAHQPLTVSGCPSSKPPARRPTLTRTGSGKTPLSFVLTAGAGAPKLKSFTVSLPSGLRFSSNPLARSLSVGGAGKYTFKVRHAKLIVTLKRAAGRAAVSIRPSALQLSKALANGLRTHKVKRLKIGVSVSDAAGKTTQFRLRIPKP